MENPVKATIDGKQITVYKNKTADVPIVYANMYMESGRAVLETCKKLGCEPFHLVSISKLRWDEELSPWEHKPIVSKNDRFTGEADQYARCLVENIVPFAEGEIEQPAYRIIAGYSMGGLFALYAPYVTTIFSGSVSASGSVWYPNFVSYTKKHEYRKNPAAIYLSLGDLESCTKNPYLHRTEWCMEELCSFYQQKGIHTLFELNPGNHYKDAAYRLAKGFTWMCTRLSSHSIS